MPYIHVTTSGELDAHKEELLKTELGRAIEALPGKSEQWLMVQCTPEAHLWLAGSDEPCALAEVSIYGAAPADAYDALTGRLTEILESVLDVDAARVYVKYAETEYWGWNGRNF